MIQGILLDIEGTTSSISFVHDVMFPFVREHLTGFLDENLDGDKVQAACEQIARDKGMRSLKEWSDGAGNGASLQSLVETEVNRLMDRDEKSTGLKALQGLIWDSGFKSGQLQAHIYDDVLPAIKTWREAGIDVRIYSSGSIAAQKLFFGHLAGHGDCLELFSGHYDTTIGGKKEADSYSRVAESWGLSADSILFISDVVEELLAAQKAGLRVLASLRPGNKPLPDDFGIACIDSFDQVNLDLG